MKRNILATLGLTLGILSGIAAPKVISNIEDIANDKVYLLKREGSSIEINGYVYAKATREGSHLLCATGTKADTAATVARFSIHYSEREKAYFLYNLGAEMFVSGNASKKLAVITAAAESCMPIYNPKSKFWMLVCAGYSIGLDADTGSHIFLDDMNVRESKKLGNHFTIQESRAEVLSQEQIDAIEAKVAAGRETKLKTYRTFLKNAAQVVNTNDLTRYIGDFDLDELTYAMDNSDKYSMSEIEEIYQRTLLGRFPREGRYYRFHNAQRPGERKSNVLATATDGSLFVRQLEYLSYATATDGCSDDLNLVSVHYNGGDAMQVCLKSAAFNQYFKGGANQEKVTLTSDIDDATVYATDFFSQRQKRLYYSIASKNTYLTVTGGSDASLWGYNVKENASEWYLEEVKTISIPVDANGYAAFCLPCGFTAPEGAKVFTVAEIAGGKAYIQEIKPAVPAYTPTIIKVEAGATVAELAIGDTDNVVATAMTGNVRKSETGMPGRYVPTFGKDGITLTYAAATEDAAMPGSCYVVSDDLGALTTVINDLPEDHIESISIEEADADMLYDLHGRAVRGKLRPGVYINATTHKAVRVQ